MLFGEQDETINRKTRMAIQSGLKPIFCIGETMENGKRVRPLLSLETDKRGIDQLTTDDIRKVLIAYEPIWAIGTGKTAAPEQVQKCMLIFDGLLQGTMKTGWPSSPILYGGSVNPDNIGKLMAQPDIMVPWWGEPA